MKNWGKTLCWSWTQQKKHPEPVSVPPHRWQGSTAGSVQPTQGQHHNTTCILPTTNILHLIWETLWRPAGDKTRTSTRHRTIPEHKSGRNKTESMAQTPVSAAHLLLHFLRSLISTGDRIPTTAIDSRFWFRFLGFIVSLMSVLLWFPLKTKWFRISTKYKSKFKSFWEIQH